MLVSTGSECASVRCRDQSPCRSHCVSVGQVEFMVTLGPPAWTGFPCVYIRASGLDRLPPSQSLPITGFPFRRASQVYLDKAVLTPRLGLFVPMRGVPRAADLQPIVAEGGKLRAGFHEAGKAGR